MSIETFLARLVELGIWLELDTTQAEPIIAVCGDQSRLTERIRTYIQLHQGELVQYLSVQPGSSPIANISRNDQGEPTGEASVLFCFTCRCGLVEREYESAWRLTPDGLEFCAQCWQDRGLDHSAKALPWLNDRGLPVDLDARIEAFVTGPGCASCGGYEWIIDEPTGALVCPCLITKREEAARLDRERSKAPQLAQMVVRQQSASAKVDAKPFALTH